jgi:4-azaleucine resistance transporter AzlC
VAAYRRPDRARPGQDGRVSSIRSGARAAVPLAVAIAGFGVSFGVLARSAHFGSLAPIVMSAVTFAGSAQFAAVSILASGGSAAAAVVAAVLLNARYGPIGLSVAPEFQGSRWRRLLHAQLIVDESWALGHKGDGQYDLGRILGAGLTCYVAWVAGTAVGVMAGNLVGNPNRWGLDAAFPAMFLAPQLRSQRAATAALAGAAIAVVLVPLAPAGVPIIAASTACLLGLRR